MSAQTICKLFDLPLGSRFRYADQATQRVYVLLNRADCGLVADAPEEPTSRALQGMYSAAESPDEFREMLVQFVPVVIAQAGAGNQGEVGQ